MQNLLLSPSDMIPAVIYTLAMVMWSTLLYFINKKNNFLKVSRNMISATHAIGVTVFYILQVPAEYVIYWSTTYYLFDSFFELLAVRKFSDLFMIFHHIISIGVVQHLDTSPCGIFVHYCFVITEFSNFPLYIVYHLKTIKSERKYLIKLLTFLELVFFVVLRLIVGLINLYLLATSEFVTVFLMSAGILVYIMSAVWTRGVYKQLMK